MVGCDLSPNTSPGFIAAWLVVCTTGHTTATMAGIMRTRLGSTYCLNKDVLKFEEVDIE